MNIEDLEFEGLTIEQFKGIIANEVKNQLEIIKKNRFKISAKDLDNVNRVRMYWDEVASVECKRLFKQEKQNIAQNVKEYGIDKIFESIDLVWSSPIMKGKNQYQKYLKSLGWCMKPESLEKILKGYYNRDKQGYQNEEFDKEDNGFD
jgi:hypothetical protein